MKKSASSLLIFAVLLCLTFLAQGSWAAPAASVAAPQIKYEKYTLKNGLEVILSEDHRLPLVAVNFWYHVGPANEGAGRTGFAHLFEHMMFQGSGHVGDGHALPAPRRRPAPRHQRHHRLRPHQLLRDAALQPARAGAVAGERPHGLPARPLDQTMLANQQDVVRNERRQSVENPPYGLGRGGALCTSCFPQGHPYYAAVIGSHADIQAAKLEDVRDFFKHYYAPNNASLAIVGDIDPAQTKALVEKYFGIAQARRRRCQPITVDDAADHGRAARAWSTDQVELPRVYMALAHAADLQAGRCRSRLGRPRSSAAASRAGSTRGWSTRSRSRRTCKCRAEPAARFRLSAAGYRETGRQT